MTKHTQHKHHGVIAKLRRATHSGLRRVGMNLKNQRMFTRFDCTIPVQIHTDTPGELSIINAVAKNVSSGGMLIKCATALCTLTTCHISFHMPDWLPGSNRSREVIAYAHVRHVDASGQYFGVAFNAPV